jgi:hypothetical protein
LSDTTLVLTPAAIKTIGAMQQRLVDVDRQYGDSPQTTKMLWSLLQALIGMIRLGGEISQDDELSLYGIAFIHYGVNFSAERDGDQRDPLLGTWSLNS